jgi:UDP-galactopyranose mutase
LSKDIKKNKNVLIVGAGPVGCTVANILSNKNYKIRIVDSRNHVAGNCYDYHDKFGVLVHKYGPHYFRSNNKKIINYLSKFTKWIPGEYIVNSFVDKKLYEFPINLNTINMFFSTNFNSAEAKKFLKEKSIKNKNSKKKNFETYLLSKIGKDLYEKFYKNYTIKQWDTNPKLLNESIAKRIPLRFNLDKNYIISKYKLMPKNGFTEMFKKMIAKKNITVQLKKKFFYSSRVPKKFDIIIYTGPIDSFFNYKFGRLGWRSLKFVFKTYKKKFKQNCLQINYPNDYKFTRSVEYKHVTKQKSIYTTLSYEYPKSVGDPYYPISTSKDKKILNIYNNEKKKLEKNKIFFAGRLADYKYINTDEAVETGLLLAKKIFKIS